LAQLGLGCGGVMYKYRQLFLSEGSNLSEGSSEPLLNRTASFESGALECRTWEGVVNF